MKQVASLNQNCISGQFLDQLLKQAQSAPTNLSQNWSAPYKS